MHLWFLRNRYPTKQLPAAVGISSFGSIESLTIMITVKHLTHLALMYIFFHALSAFYCRYFYKFSRGMYVR